MGTVLLPPVPLASNGLVCTCTSPTPKAQPQHQPCSCACTKWPRGDKLWFHWTPPCFLTPLWHFISGETEALQHSEAPCHCSRGRELVPSPSKPTQLSQFEVPGG